MLGPNSSAQISIDTLQVIRGHYDRRDFAEAIAWASRNQDLLRERWNDING